MVSRLLSLVFFTLLSAAIAAAQSGNAPKAVVKPTPEPASPAESEPALKTLPATESFTDPGKKFSIALPREVFSVRTEPAGSGQRTVVYKWLLREGVFFISNTTHDEDVFTSKEAADSYVDTFIDELKRVSTFKFDGFPLPVTAGVFNGKEVVRTNAEGKKVIVRIMVAGNEAYTLTASTDETIEDAEPLMRKALESFKPGMKSVPGT